MRISQSLVRGFNWQCRMFNGAVFHFWTAWEISRKRARKELLQIANGGCTPLIYTEKDIDYLWFNKNVRQ